MEEWKTTKILNSRLIPSHMVNNIRSLKYRIMIKFPQSSHSKYCASFDFVEKKWLNVTSERLFDGTDEINAHH